MNSHGEGPLSDIMVGQTKEAGNFAYQFPNWEGLSAGVIKCPKNVLKGLR